MPDIGVALLIRDTNNLGEKLQQVAGKTGWLLGVKQVGSGEKVSEMST